MSPWSGSFCRRGGAGRREGREGAPPGGGASCAPDHTEGVPELSIACERPRMAETLGGRLRRAEAALRRPGTGPDAEWAERRRRLRLDLLREELQAASGRLRARHAGGAP